MTEYIEREAAIAAIMSEPPDAHYPHWYADKIKSIPAADVAPVKHGKWEEAIEPLGWHKVIVASCSVCGDSWVLDEFTIDEYAKWHQYCTSCGARMDGYITMPDTEDEDG